MKKTLISLVLLASAIAANAQTKMIVFIEGQRAGTATYSVSTSKSGNHLLGFSMNIDYSGVKASFKVTHEALPSGMPVKTRAVTEQSDVVFTSSTSQIIVETTIDGKRSKKTLSVKPDQKLVDASITWFRSATPKLNEVSEFWAPNKEMTGLKKRSQTYLGKKSIKVAGKTVDANVVKDQDGEATYYDDHGVPYLMEFEEGGLKFRVERAKI